MRKCIILFITALLLLFVLDKLITYINNCNTVKHGSETTIILSTYCNYTSNNVECD